jgi:hypothetical protein
MTQILTTTKVAKKVNATAKDEKYNYNVEYSVTEDENKTLESLSVTVTAISNNAYVASATLTPSSGDRCVVSKDGADSEAINAMFSNIIAEVNSTITV